MRNAGLSELEAEARDKAQYLLEKANALRMEQEDEIKHINEVNHLSHLLPFALSLSPLCISPSLLPCPFAPSPPLFLTPSVYLPCSQLILGSQCHAIRDTQILEKKQILSELQEEEKRLDAMMEVERRRAIKMQEEIDEMRKQQRIE